jgi:hypothetical protein
MGLPYLTLELTTCQYRRFQRCFCSNSPPRAFFRFSISHHIITRSTFKWAVSARRTVPV